MECSSSAASPSRYSSSSRLSKTSSRGEPVFAPSSGGVGSIALLHGSEWTRNPSDLAWAAYAMTDHDPGVAGADAALSISCGTRRGDDAVSRPGCARLPPPGRCRGRTGPRDAAGRGCPVSLDWSDSNPLTCDGPDRLRRAWLG